MALPKINNVPKYTLTIPSTKKQITYRPFFVKEQKVLLIALESQDEDQILKATTDMIAACVEDNINVNKMPTFDVEYIFTQIRSKSVGETSKVNIACSSCKEYNEVEVHLDKIKIDIPSKNNEIKLNDNYTVVMNYPSYTNLIKIKSKRGTITSTMYESVLLSLDKLKTPEEVISFADEPEAEVDNFLQSLTSDQFQQLVKFVDSTPRLKHDVKFNCSSCNHTNTKTLQGLQDFF
jgi:transcription elongation factor Elf1